MEIQLIDAMEMGRYDPNIFYLRNHHELKVGNMVKVCNGKEMFWVILKGVNPDDMYRGVINNSLRSTRDYNFGDTILFDRRKIYKIAELKVDDNVKVGNAKERVSVVIKDVNPDGMCRGVVNGYFGTSDYNYGDTILIERSNIYQVIFGINNNQD